MNKPHLFLARAGFAVIWERFVMGEGTQIWVLWNDSEPVAGPVHNHASTARWVWGSAAAASEMLELWKASEDFIPDSDFQVCELQGAFTAYEAQEATAKYSVPNNDTQHGD